MAKFRNSAGDVIETDDPATINNYRMRAGFTEVEESGAKGSRKSKSQSESDTDKP